MKLADRIAIVTGAAKGMGRDICLTLAREGANLTIAAREVGPLEALGVEISAIGRRAIAVPTDVTDEPAVERLVARARETFGRIDILVNAAGVTGPIETPVWEIKADDFDHVIAVNLRGTFLPTKHVLPAMIKQRYGKIVNISGTSGLRLVVACLTATTAHAQFGVPWRHAPTLVAISSADDDPRLSLVDEAVSFWNKTLEEIGSGFRLPPAERLVKPVPEDALQALSRSIVGGSRPVDIPPALRTPLRDLTTMLADPESG